MSKPDPWAKYEVTPDPWAQYQVGESDSGFDTPPAAQFAPKS
jgi:hypothetical protein